MKEILNYLTNSTAPSAGFSLGRLKDDPGDGSGSGVIVATHNDFLYALYAPILKYLGAVSDTDESESASDFTDALERIAQTLGASVHIASYDYLDKSYILRDGIIWRANANIDTGVDGTTFILQFSAGKWDSTIINREQVSGGAISINVTDSDHDVDFDTIVCFDLGTGDIISGGILTKQIDANWVVGNNQGMLDTGTVAISTTYYLFAIKKDSDSSSDYLMSLSDTSPTMPTGYTMKRNIAELITDSSANISQINNTIKKASLSELQGFVAKTGDTMTGQLVANAGIDIATGQKVLLNGANYIGHDDAGGAVKMLSLSGTMANGQVVATVAHGIANAVANGRIKVYSARIQDVSTEHSPSDPANVVIPARFLIDNTNCSIYRGIGTGTYTVVFHIAYV